MMIKHEGNVFDMSELGEAGKKLKEEVFEDLLHGGKGFRVERIVSEGQASAEGFWYDQEEAEWVIVLAGEAELEFRDNGEKRVLGVGDYVLIEARREHRVNWTSHAEKTVWLAVFFLI